MMSSRKSAGAVDAGLEACRFQVMLHQTGDVGVVFQNEYGLAQTVSPRPGGD